MNIVNKILLRLVLVPSSLYRKIGVDTRHLQLILTVKLLMDDRRPNTFHQTRQRKSGKVISSATLGTMILSAFLGLIYLFSFRISNELVTQLTFYFSMFIVMLVSTLISDFTSVLIDVRDNYIILPKPVGDKTFVLSRLLHILIHITKIILPMVLPGLIYMVLVKGLWAAIIFLVMILSATAFTVFLINVIYLIILKVTSPQKFQAIISYVQIFMTVLIFMAYQLMLQFAGKIELGSFAITPHIYTWLLPSYWFALGSAFFISFSWQPYFIIGALLAILVPVLSLWLVITWFAPSFNQNLSLITGITEESGSIKAQSVDGSRRFSLADRMAVLFAKKGEERMAFLITWKLTNRLREFKLKVYPSVGFLLVLFIVMFLNYKGLSLQELRRQQGDVRSILISIIYSGSFLMLVAIRQLQYSDSFKAAWFYFTAPVKKPGLIFSGSLKAVIIKFYLPVIGMLSIIGIMFLGFNLVPNILLGVCNVLLGSVILSLFTFKNFPFSALQETSQKFGAIIRSSLSMLMIFSLGGLHYVVYDMRIVVVIGTFLSGLATWLLMDHLKNKSWDDVIASYSGQ